MEKEEKLDLDDLINDYRVENVDAFRTYLTGVWKDLAERSDNKFMGINKITFSKYYELPGIIFDRLFNVFDEDNSEYLGLDQFINGMITLFSTDFDEMVKFVFKFYDFDKDGKISKEDIRIVLSYIPLNQHKIERNSKDLQTEDFEDRIESQDELHKTLDSIFVDSKTIGEEEFVKVVEDVNSDIFLFILIFLMERRPFNNKTIKNLENIKKSPKITKSPGSKKIVFPSLNSIFLPSHTITNSPGFKRTKSQEKSSMTNTEILDKKAESKKEAQEKTDILLKLSGIGKSLGKPKPKGVPTFKPNVTIKKKPKESPKEKHQQPVRKMKHLQEKEDNNERRDSKQNIGVLLPARKFEDNDEGRTSHNDNDSCDSNNDFQLEAKEEKDKENYSGYMYKLSANKKLKQIWFSLIYKDLYYYKSKEDTVHRGMHNLSGVFLKEEKECDINDKHFYCFTIITRTKSRKYYVDNKKEYEGWISNIQKAIGYSDLNVLYDIKEELGCGKFALVRLGINKLTHEKVAIKILAKDDMSPFALEQIKTEIEILKIANHPHIIRLYDVFENIDYIYIIMEYCSGGDLFSYLENRNFKIPESRAADIVEQLATSIYFLHEYGIVHRDLKPENILMDDASDNANIKLLDFGLGKILGPNETCNDIFGTLSYVAPEVLQGKPYNKSVDIWGLGIISYLLLTGFLPFDDESDEEIKRMTIEDPVPYPPTIWTGISKEGKGFIQDLLIKSPEKRLDIKQVLDHPWLQKYIKLSQRNSTNILNVNTVTTGGAEFKIYSSPGGTSRKSSSNDVTSFDNFDLNRTNSKDSEPQSSSNILNVLTLPGVAPNLPLYTNKKI